MKKRGFCKTHSKIHINGEWISILRVIRFLRKMDFLEDSRKDYRQSNVVLIETKCDQCRA